MTRVHLRVSAKPQPKVAQQFAVVNRGFSLALAGSAKWGKSTQNGTMYACFSSMGAAQQYIDLNEGMLLYAKVVQIA